MLKIILMVFFACLQFNTCSGLTFDSDTWDLGQVKEGQVASHVFVVKNDSAQVLQIKSVLPSCGCMTAKIDQEALGSGESANLDVSFNSHGYSGNVQQFVYLNTDSPDKPVTKFTVKANVVK
jgi:hypothetical protein